MTYRISVVIVLYNDMPHGLKAIESVINQTFQDIRIVILDNGSTDDTRNVIQKYAADPRISLIRNANNQRSEFAVRESLKIETEYLSFLFSDDYYHPERIQRAMEYFDKSPDSGFVFFNNSFVNEHGQPISYVPNTLFSGDISTMDSVQHLNHIFFRGNSLHPCGLVVRTAVYRGLGGFKPYLHRIGDMCFFARLLANARGDFLVDRMQCITVWSNSRNESAKNDGLSNHIAFERTVFLEQFLQSDLLALVPKIFRCESSSRVLDTAEQLWILGHQSLIPDAVDCRLFAFRTLYMAADLNDPALEERVLFQTGASVSQYLYQLSASASLSTNLTPWNIIKVLVKRIPYSRRVYDFLRGMAKRGL